MLNLLFEGNFKRLGFILNCQVTFQCEDFLMTVKCLNEENFVLLCWFLRDGFDCVCVEHRYDETTVVKFLVSYDWQVRYESFLTFFLMEIAL